MAGTPLTPTQRYVNVGNREWLWVPADGIADLSAPTRTELDTGTDLTDEVAEWAGFTLSTEFVDAPDVGSRITEKLPGRFTIEDSSITFYASKDSADVRDVFVIALSGDPQSGTIVVFPEGDGPASGGIGTKMDLWPVVVGSTAFDGGVDDPSRIIVSFGTRKPELNVTIPPVV